MTENNNKNKYNIGGIATGNIIHFESKFTGNASGGTINTEQKPNKLSQIKREILTKWTQQGFTEQEAQEWISAGFTTKIFR